jgi:hypothetical protein
MLDVLPESDSHQIHISTIGGPVGAKKYHPELTYHVLHWLVRPALAEYSHFLLLKAMTTRLLALSITFLG